VPGSFFVVLGRTAAEIVGVRSTVVVILIEMKDVWELFFDWNAEKQTGFFSVGTYHREMQGEVLGTFNR
jgi:hypothetical protein